jgi:hypothetical protein
MNTDRHGYPINGFFVAHHRFTGPAFKPGGEWGNIVDDPNATEEDVIEAIIEAFKDAAHAPDRSDLRVWHIIPGKLPEDCTAWAIEAMVQTLEDRL